MTRGRFSTFSPKALSFLRALKRNNDREWFRARKDQYELLLRAPMIGLIERLARDFRTFAPDLVANPKTSLYRIYRDTRFSENKTPLKTPYHGGLSLPGPGQTSGRWPVPRGRARLGMGRRRNVRARDIADSGRARAHRGPFPQAARYCRIARLQARRRAAFRRAAPTSATWLSQRSPSPRISQVSAVPGGQGISGGVRDEPSLLSGRLERLSAGRSARQVPERATHRPAITPSRRKPRIRGHNLA